MELKDLEFGCSPFRSFRVGLRQEWKPVRRKQVPRQSHLDPLILIWIAKSSPWFLLNLSIDVIRECECVYVASGISTFYKDSVARSWNRTVCCWKCSTMFAKVWSLIMWSIIHPWLRTIIEVDTAEHWSPPRIKGGGRDGDSLIGEPTEVVSTLETLRQVALGAACCRLNTEGQSRSVVAVAAKGFEGFWKVEWIECSMNLMMSRYV